ncbi:hypothetical protein DAPPUDRAFT_248435 [Daphnia pulex]|uniref:Retrotransposon Copia-like N-terminal domain-containing protein n=1 Tax=Daphnia pulex TaxID=6669 RepID=E9GUN5_DAPPU|nr:hypothetical protein DAPPUDRAFT_248435 [Daphnia pulex]|eukprot:EFX76761.1 hypothetical protein DAPPUDRAFT_248435 [Daphnia pulex]
MTSIFVFTVKDVAVVAHIDKLNGANFQVWKFQTCLRLRNQRLMDLVIGTEAKPNPIVASGVTTNQAAITSWKQKDNTTQLLISSTIYFDQQRSLITSTSARDAGTSHQSFLIYQYKEGHDISSHVTALELMASQLQDVGYPVLDDQFLIHQYKEGHDISSHVTAIELMASQLQDIGSPVSDDQVITEVASTACRH